MDYVRPKVRRPATPDADRRTAVPAGGLPAAAARELDDGPERALPRHGAGRYGAAAVAPDQQARSRAINDTGTPSTDHLHRQLRRHHRHRQEERHRDIDPL
ncbi:hypothetical protein ABLO01_09860 [Mycobacterium tuberculosis]|uniref:hypothetical protein n=1 Tax=Mycobacterium tuberculosis TaxID=1773 RepID=UPI0032B4639A